MHLSAQVPVQARGMAGGVEQEHSKFIKIPEQAQKVNNLIVDKVIVYFPKDLFFSSYAAFLDVTWNLCFGP